MFQLDEARTFEQRKMQMGDIDTTVRRPQDKEAQETRDNSKDKSKESQPIDNI